MPALGSPEAVASGGATGEASAQGAVAAKMAKGGPDGRLSATPRILSAQLR